jgi:hypothetical protein
MSEDLCTLSLREGPNGKFWFCFTCRGQWPCSRVTGEDGEQTKTD